MKWVTNVCAGWEVGETLRQRNAQQKNLKIRKPWYVVTEHLHQIEKRGMGEKHTSTTSLLSNAKTASFMRPPDAPIECKITSNQKIQSRILTRNFVPNFQMS